MAKKVESLACVLAGGSGTRLAPLSLTTEGKLPKQFLTLIKTRTMLQETLHRMPKNIPVLIIPEEKYKSVVEEQNENRAEIIAEPFGCNTAAAIGLAAVYALAKGKSEKTVLFITPADHLMDTRYFRKYYDLAVKGAEGGKIVALGITPDRPETGYGYIKANKKMQYIIGLQPTYETEAFVEKPDAAKAQEYIDSGDYFWNAGIFAFTIKTILKALETHTPVIFDAVNTIKEAIGTENEAEVIKQEYQKIKDSGQNISIDYAVMEKEAGKILTLPVEQKLNWNDVGGWVALEKYFKADEENNKVSNNAEVEECQNTFILNYRTGQKVKVKGLNELLVVNSDNGVLVCQKEQAQRAKEIIPALTAGQKEIMIDSANVQVNNGSELAIACLGCSDLKIECSQDELLITK
jgi:mannose-1-phosphate guanylyltransferase